MMKDFKKCPDGGIKEKKEAILRSKLVEEHRYQFGRFDVTEVEKKCGKLPEEKDDKGWVLPYEVGVEAKRVWWGQPKGALRVEIGISDEGIYIQEGDMKKFGRRSVLNEADGKIKYTSVE